VPRAQLTAELEPDRPVPSTGVTPAIGLPSTLLERRPDVRGAERDLAAATADVGVAVADQFPRVSLVGTAGFESVYTGQLISEASRYWSIVPQLSVPVFAGGRLRENVHAAEAARDAALATYRSTVLKAFSDTESALIRYSADTRRAATLAGARDQLAQVHALEQRREAAGDVAHLDVLSARLALDQMADQAVSSTAQSALDFVSLEKALGGGWQPQL